MKLKFSSRSLLILVLLVCSFKLKAQILTDSLKSKEEYIINTTIYKKGIYKTFLEFKYNSPSITSAFTFNKNNVWLLEDEDKGDRFRKDEYWGFCDGEKVYIRREKNYEMLETGRYCYFEVPHSGFIPGSSISNSSPSTPHSSGVIIPGLTPETDGLIINFNNGKIFEINKKLFINILETDDPELLKEYKRESLKTTKYREYIVLYNKRNSDKVK